MRCREIICEIEIGGGVTSGHLDDLRTGKDFTSKQGELFPDTANSEPDLSADRKLELMGRLGAMWVARKQDGVSDATGKPEYTYYLFDKGVPVAYVAVNDPLSTPGDGYRRPYAEVHGTGYRVVSVYIDGSHRGRGLALALYEWLLHNVCDYLMPDELQTPGGVHIWKSMLNVRSRFAVMVYDPDRGIARRRWPGKDFKQVYRNDRLRAFVTLPAKVDDVIYGDDA